MENGIDEIVRKFNERGAGFGMNALLAPGARGRKFGVRVYYFDGGRKKLDTKGSDFPEQIEKYLDGMFRKFAAPGATPFGTF